MSNSIDDRFMRIVREMDAELTTASKEIADLKSKLRIANYPTEQATKCGKCGCYKHTPWRDDDFGYVCATCLVEINDDRVEALEKALGEIAKQKLDAEMDDEMKDSADWQGGYEAVVLVARNALDSENAEAIHGEKVSTP